MSTPDAFEAEVRDHDARVAATGLKLWVGSEPTFTDRFASTPEWLYDALGGEKEARAQALLRVLHARRPGALVLRTEGRRYAGEVAPRWNLGLLRWRDGTPLWRGPRDPMLAEPGAPSLEEVLPDFGDDVAGFLERLAETERRALAAGAACLAFSGCTPPPDPGLALTTITPDPAVIEINATPSTDAFDFLKRSRRMYFAAAEVGLAPYRLHYNGAVADSGGGGQITLGGPTPQQSPFVREPMLLPRLVRFLNRHPSLSYLYCHDFLGAGGQSARADERGNGSLDELMLALALVEREAEPTPERVWQCLAPFLTDAAGNSHRAEINVEKLSDPNGGMRGRLGLVEFRALRMQHTPERVTAIACLLRALVAMLATTPYDEPLVDWGRELHDRFALPLVLEQDLADVLSRLHEHGFGLGPATTALLQADEFRHLADIALPGATLELRRALEFWPLLGDTSSPEQGGSSRLMDASTARIELRLRPHDDRGAHWQIGAGGTALPLRDAHDAGRPVRVAGLRYRAFVPTPGLHPTLPAQSPVVLQLRHAPSGQALALTVHGWRPDGGAYDGLPADLAEAARRRAERVTLDPMPAGLAEPLATGARPGLSPYTLDLRWPA